MIEGMMRAVLLLQCPDTSGIVATVGAFVADAGGNIVAYDALTGKILWHARVGGVSNAPQTYKIDGRQHVLVAAGDQLFAFVLMP